MVAGVGPAAGQHGQRRANTFGYLALQGTDYCQGLADSSAQSFIDLLPGLRQANADCDAVVLIWANLPSHKTAAVEAAARRHQIYLVNNVAYAPDLNPIEGVWKGLKRRVSQQGIIASVAHLRALIDTWFYELAQSASLARDWLRRILAKALPPTCAISFC